MRGQPEATARSKHCFFHSGEMFRDATNRSGDGDVDSTSQREECQGLSPPQLRLLDVSRPVFTPRTDSIRLRAIGQFHFGCWLLYAASSIVWGRTFPEPKAAPHAMVRILDVTSIVKERNY